MQRDWATVRDILLGVEAQEDMFTAFVPEDIPRAMRDCKNDDDKRRYYKHYEHVALLMEAGLVEGQSCGVFVSGGVPSMRFNAYNPYRLTWQGHEFLDSIRDENVWNKIQTQAVDKGATLSFEVIKELGVGFIKAAVGLPS